MTALEEFLKKLREDPARELQKEFEDFLREFVVEGQLKKMDFASFLKQDKEIQEEAIQKFLNLSLKLGHGDKYAVDHKPIYKMEFDDFVQRIEFGDTANKKKFESFLSGWTKQDSTKTLENFSQMARPEQEAIFSKFQEEELRETTPKIQEDRFSVSYNRNSENDIKYDRGEEKWLGQTHEKKQEKEQSMLTAMMEERAAEPDRSSEDKKEDPWSSLYR